MALSQPSQDVFCKTLKTRTLKWVLGLVTKTDINITGLQILPLFLFFFSPSKVTCSTFQQKWKFKRLLVPMVHVSARCRSSMQLLRMSLSRALSKHFTLLYVSRLWICSPVQTHCKHKETLHIAAPVKFFLYCSSNEAYCSRGQKRDFTWKAFILFDTQTLLRSDECSLCWGSRGWLSVKSMLRRISRCLFIFLLFLILYCQPFWSRLSGALWKPSGPDIKDDCSLIPEGSERKAL